MSLALSIRGPACAELKGRLHAAEHVILEHSLTGIFPSRAGHDVQRKEMLLAWMRSPSPRCLGPLDELRFTLRAG